MRTRSALFAGNFRFRLEMRPILLLALTAMVSLLAGCNRHEDIYTIAFRSRSGQELATGFIMLTGAPAAAGTISGRYEVKSRHVSPTSHEIEMFYQLFNRRETGRTEWTVGSARMGVSPSYFDFMPGAVDSNIVANALPTLSGRWRGRWSYATAAGGQEGGSFDVARK